jgi:hypothetical protein
MAVMPVAENRMVYVSMGSHMKSFSKGYTYSFEVHLMENGGISEF